MFFRMENSCALTSAVIKGYGFWLIIRWAYGVPDHMIHVPVILTAVGSPLVFAENGHKIIQCGGSTIGLPLVAHGLVALQSRPPANMYMIPGFVLLGCGF